MLAVFYFRIKCIWVSLQNLSHDFLSLLIKFENVMTVRALTTLSTHFSIPETVTVKLNALCFLTFALDFLGVRVFFRVLKTLMSCSLVINLGGWIFFFNLISFELFGIHIHASLIWLILIFKFTLFMTLKIMFGLLKVVLSEKDLGLKFMWMSIFRAILVNVWHDVWSVKQWC